MRRCYANDFSGLRCVAAAACGGCLQKETRQTIYLGPSGAIWPVITGTVVVEARGWVEGNAWVLDQALRNPIFGENRLIFGRAPAAGCAVGS